MPAGHMHADRLARLGLDLLQEIDRVGLQDRHVGIGVQRMKPAGGVPGRTGSQNRALDERDVCPAEFRQMVEDGGPNNAAPDDDDPIMRIHTSTPAKIDPLSARLAEVPFGRLDISVH